MTLDPKLLEFATPAYVDHIKAVLDTGSLRGAARALGVHHRSIGRAIEQTKARAARQGYAPDHDMTRPAPPGFVVKGTSTYYDDEGKVRGQWVKTDADRQAQLAIQQAAYEALAQDLPRVQPVKPPELTSADLCTVYTLTDCHVGMLAWHKEGGDDWDVEISENVLTGAFGRLVSASPPARTCVIAQLGDFLHSDGLAPVTPTSGHILDQDGRFSKIVQAAVRILRRVIQEALRRHEKVVVLMAEGNHDLASSVWLRTMFKALYENEPRVHVLDSELPYYTMQHGKTMLAWHHGHLKKNDQLPLLFAAQFPKMWGNTTKRYCHTGHRHHVEEKEHSGMTVTQHSTLAARDAYASRGGWMSDRQAKSVTYHTEWGQVEQHTVSPEMLGLSGPKSGPK